MHDKLEEKEMHEEEEEEEEEEDGGGPYTTIAAVVGGIALAMVALVVLFADQSAWIILPMVGFMAVLGVGLGYFASRET